MSRDSNDRLPMENFRAAVMEMASRHPNKPLTEARKCLIDKRIREFFAHTPSPPDHPPYSAMIHRALQELNEEGGSSEESISNFIRKEYKELPWAHSVFLNHHLGKLCVSGEIVLTRDNSYLLAGAIRKQKPSSRRPSKRKELKRKRSKKRQRELGCPCNKQEIEAEYHLKEQMEVIEELNQALEDNTEMVDKQNQAPIGEMLQSYDDGEKGDGRKLKVLPVESLGSIMEEEIGAEYQLEESREGIEELNQALEHYTFDKQNQASISEILQSCDDGEKGDGRKLKLLPFESLGPIMEEEIEDEYQLKEPMEVIEEQNQALEDEKNYESLKLPSVESLEPIMEEEKKESSEEEQPMKSAGEENSDIVVLQPEQQLDLPLPEKFSELKSTELSYTPDQLEQRTQEKPQRRQLRPRPPKAGSLTDTSMTSLPSQNQHEVQRMQEKPQRRKLRPRPPKAGSLTDTSMAESLPSQHQHEEQQTQEKPRRRQLRPRPPKAGSLAAASTTESLPRQQEQLEQVEQPEHRGPGRPKKQREQLEQVEQPERRGRGRPRKQQEEPKQQAQPKRRGRGRPPKAQTN